MLQLKRYRDLSFRIALIAICSIVLLYMTQNRSYDSHLAIRSKQPVSKKVLILQIPDEGKIQTLLPILTNSSTKAILIPTSELISPSTNKKVFIYSTSSPNHHDQVIPLHLQLDTDGNIRRFILQKNEASQVLFKNISFSTPHMINYRGKKGSFQKVNYQNLNQDMVHLFKNKIVIISIKRFEENSVTPLGIMGESEVIANILDNYIEHRFIRKTSVTEQVLICLFIFFLSLTLLTILPTSLALMSSLLLAILYASISLLLFDKFYLWTPLLTPLLQIFITYVLISNYKLILNERTRWKLEKENHLHSEVEEMKTNFVSLFSHDLKTPLAKILAITETRLSQKDLNPKIKDDLLKIKTYSREIERYFKRILKTAQVESKNIALTKSSTDMNKLIERVIEKFRPEASEKNITINTHLPPLFLIEMDAPLIEEVLFNFIENALSHSPDNSSLSIKSAEERNHIKVSIIDQGPGIPLVIQDKIWEKFYRLESTDHGYGLGLYLSKYVIELHQGTVYLKSAKGRGSEFGFHLPIEEVKS